MKINRFDIFSLGIIFIIFLFSVARFNYLPQFIDSYYHLSVANAFIKSGGWVGWAWWDFAPLGRPHLYPPFYHFILVLLQKTGLSGLNSIRITEVLIVPLFFFSIWCILRDLVGNKFSFLVLLTLSSFFAFYSSVSGNIPASLATIFGFLSYLFLKKKRLITAALYLALSFYTHSGMPWVFLISLLFLVFFDKDYRKLSLGVILVSLLLAFPFLYHTLRYISYLDLKVLGEAKFTHFSIFIILLGVISLFLYSRKREFSILLFGGYLVGSSLVFMKYPYRFFSAQGIVGLALFSCVLLEKITSSTRREKLIMMVVIIYLFFSHATFSLEERNLKFRLFNSTYSNFLRGRIPSYHGFGSFFYPQYYLPLIEVIKKNTTPDDIISSNLRISSQVFSALTNRPSSKSVLGEIMPKQEFSYYNQAKVVIWLKVALEERSDQLKKDSWRNIYENDFAQCFLNLNYKPSLKIVKSKISFKAISFIFLLVSLLLFLKK